MRDLDDAALERRLRAVLKEHLGALPLDLTVDALDRRREAQGISQRFGRGRGIMLFAAAALLLVGGALAAGSNILRLPAVVRPVPGPSDVADATARPYVSPIPVAGPGGVWIPIGSMVTPRSGHTAVRLLDGKVLVAGGESNAGDLLISAELYDPAVGTWSATGNMPGVNTIPAVLLHDGTVLVGDAAYNPSSETWTATGPRVADVGRGATVTVLRDGTVLVTKYDGAQRYDPESGTWTATGQLNTGREYAAATLLADGMVLVAGGIVGFVDLDDSAEVYDPATGSWTAIANMPAPAGETATLLRDGKVLVAGTAPVGDPGAGYRGVAEIYDPATGTWAELPVRPGVKFNSAALLSDGTVLLTDTRQGSDDRPGCITADLFDPNTGSWTTVSSLPFCGVGSFTPLLDGTVLVAGGRECTGDGEARVCVANGAAAVYVPAGVPLPPLPHYPIAPPGDGSR